MMNGYHYDMAKKGANEYAVRVDGTKVIMRSTYASALDVYNYVKETMMASEQSYSVELVKEYDAKTKSRMDVVVKSA
ncbi:hypothetical protein PP175_26515 (plasmid) [Aneurinibacillus sp. Ricciae_BoGa-3]|uniref:hypothetical protein n=1 Tax=Aneurinibacillus sp. Ricciae_BoGa-3 TaxID=3022697 RepID=UPI002341E17C|nr:hypothetical protein [Aneurinibacillus sp. Ricciae_BoGa-3]WCK57619.1 hypothetical protein PP175_26515 [Aneurinibacillus sp. Ricciae_BoGa-3]